MTNNQTVTSEDDDLGNTILVTGGAGFIGSHLVETLIGDGAHVVILDDFSSGRWNSIRAHVKGPKCHLIEGDIRKPSDVKKALTNVEAVLHLAAIADVDFSLRFPVLVNEVNVGGTVNLLELSRRSDIKKIVCASSCAVYGEPRQLPVREEHPAKLLSPYGITKLAAEHFCRVFYEAFGLNTVCLRLFNVYGPSLEGKASSGVVAKFINQLKEGNPPVFIERENRRETLYT